MLDVVRHNHAIVNSPGMVDISDTDSPYTVLDTDIILFVDTDDGAVTILMPAGIDGRHLKVVNCGSSGNSVTVTPYGTEQIYGSGAGVDVILIDGEVIDIHFKTTRNWW